MKPSELRELLVGHGVTFEELLMLEMIRDMEERAEFDAAGVRIIDVVSAANQPNQTNKSKLASHATTYKYIQNLNNRLLITKQVDDKDTRVTRLQVTSTGKKLLAELGG